MTRHSRLTVARGMLPGMKDRPIPLIADRNALAAADRRSLIRALTCKALASVRVKALALAISCAAHGPMTLRPR